MFVLCHFVLDFVLVYEEINDELPTKEVLRFRNRYMKNLQKSQLEFEEVCLFSLFFFNSSVDDTR